MNNEEKEYVPLVDPALADEIRRSAKMTKFAKAERLLRRTLLELVQQNASMFLFIKDDEVREYWERMSRECAKTLESRRAAWKKYNLKLAAYEKLTPEERKLVGMRKPAKPTGEPVE